jgi:hypothetical protein
MSSGDIYVSEDDPRAFGIHAMSWPSGPVFTCTQSVSGRLPELRTGATVSLSATGAQRASMSRIRQQRMRTAESAAEDTEEGFAEEPVSLRC